VAMAAELERASTQAEVMRSRHITECVFRPHVTAVVGGAGGVEIGFGGIGGQRRSSSTIAHRGTITTWTATASRAPRTLVSETHLEILSRVSLVSRMRVCQKRKP
jgi:hypothetical protein